ncbi:hypothetical protein Trydic_g17426 [Trypoxylus dichotomus]
MNAVNLPLALFTVILRRFIDKFRATQQRTLILRSTAPWLIDTSLAKSCMYAYLFFTGIYYTMKHMQRGTIVSLAKKCSDCAVTIKDRYVRKRDYSSKNRSSLVKNIVRGRDGQQRALRYIASMIPHETIISPTPNILTHNNVEQTNQACQNFQRELINYTTNPFLEPSPIHRARAQSLIYHRENYDNPQAPSTLDTAGDPNFSNNEDVIQIDLTESKEMTPVALETMTIANGVQADRTENDGKLGRKRKPRNCLTLRGRKILKNDLTFCSDNVVRKTRSGKVYGYMTGQRGASKIIRKLV